MSVRVPNDQTSEAVRPVEFVARTFPIVPAVVSVDVAIFHTSEARFPNVVRERVADDQTASGMVSASEVDAVSTVALVLALIVVTAAAIWALVLALTEAVPAVIAAASEDDEFATAVLTPEIAEARDVEADNTLPFAVVTLAETVASDAPRDVEAAKTLVFVLALIPDAKDDEAFPTVVLVFELTAVVPAEIAFASEVDAEPTIELVLPFTLAATEDEAAEMAEASDEEADVTSDCSANVPEVSVPAVIVRTPNDQTWDAVRPVEFVARTFPIVPAFVSVEVAMFQTSEASEPNDVRERVAVDQTANGIVAANDVEAVSTVTFVLVLIVEIAEVIWEFVLALIPAASDEDAFKTEVLTAEIAEANEDDADPTTLVVFALMPEASEVEALPTTVLVFELTAVVPAEIAAASEDDEFATAVLTPEIAEARDVEADNTLPFAVVTLAETVASDAPRDVEAARTVAFVLAFTPAASDEDAFKTVVLTPEIAFARDVEADVTSDWRAKAPEVSVPAVSVRVPNDQTSEAVRPVEFVARTFPIVPAVVSVDVAIFHTSEARFPNVVRERVADDQTASGIVAAREVEAVSTVAFVFASIVLIADVIWEFVLALTFEATDVDAAVISAANVDVAVFTMLLVLPLTAAVPALIAEARDEDEFATAVLTPDIAFAREVEAERIFPFAVVTLVETVARDAPRDVEAAKTAALVFAFIPAANDDDAFPTVVLVLLLTAVVPAEIAAASEDDEFATAVLTPEIAAASDDDADVTSD